MEIEKEILSRPSEFSSYAVLDAMCNPALSSAKPPPPVSTAVIGASVQPSNPTPIPVALLPAKQDTGKSLGHKPALAGTDAAGALLCLS